MTGTGYSLESKGVTVDEGEGASNEIENYNTENSNDNESIVGVGISTDITVTAPVGGNIEVGTVSFVNKDTESSNFGLAPLLDNYNYLSYGLAAGVEGSWNLNFFLIFADDNFTYDNFKDAGSSYAINLPKIRLPISITYGRARTKMGSLTGYKILKLGIGPGFGISNSNTNTIMKKAPNRYDGPKVNWIIDNGITP